MRWVADRTGRFLHRPHYDADELDHQCEQLIREFLQAQHGKVTFPVATDDLTKLIERDAADLDLYATFPEEDEEGATDFYRGRPPDVKIAVRLSTANRENRLRTTLTHEYGHVRFHRVLFDAETKPLSLFEEDNPDRLAGTIRCKRGNIVGASQQDWMEWQAGYICGAILIPLTALITSVRHFRLVHGVPMETLAVSSAEGRSLVAAIASEFQTSREAAQVRLLQCQCLEQADAGRPRSLFTEIR